MDDLTKKFAELAKGAKAFTEKYKEGISKADCGDTCPPEVMCILSDLGYAFRSLSAQIDWLNERLSTHMQGHLPPINSTEQMSRAVEALGLDSEYDVQKRTIYAGRGRFLVG